MKDWIEEHYWRVRYQPDKIHLDQLRAIIQAAWDAVPLRNANRDRAVELRG
jgi:hypothetical protein